MTAPTPRTIAALDTPQAEIEAEATRIWAERDRRIAALNERQLERIRLSLPLTDPDRHALDTVADEAFAHLAPGCPDAAVTA